jgi:hypothetical protein
MDLGELDRGMKPRSVGSEQHLCGPARRTASASRSKRRSADVSVQTFGWRASKSMTARWARQSSAKLPRCGITKATSECSAASAMGNASPITS